MTHEATYANLRTIGLNRKKCTKALAVFWASVQSSAPLWTTKRKSDSNIALQRHEWFAKDGLKPAGTFEADLNFQLFPWNLQPSQCCLHSLCWNGGLAGIRQSVLMPSCDLIGMSENLLGITVGQHWIRIVLGVLGTLFTTINNIDYIATIRNISQRLWLVVWHCSYSFKLVRLRIVDVSQLEDVQMLHRPKWP